MRNRTKTRQQPIFWRRKWYSEVQCHLAFLVLSCYHVLSFMTCMDLLSRTWWAPSSTPIWNTGIFSHHHAQTLNCYPVIVIITIIVAIHAHHFHYQWVISSCSSKANVIGLGDWLSLFSEVLSVSHWMCFYYCIYMYLVAFLCCYFQTVYVQWRQNVSCSTWTVWCHYQQLIWWHMLSPKQCERHKEGLVSVTHCI